MFRKNRRSWWLGLSGLALLALSAGLVGAQEAQAPKVGQKAPDFKVQLTNGKTISLQDKELRGKVIYLDFFATW